MSHRSLRIVVRLLRTLTLALALICVVLVFKTEAAHAGDGEGGVADPLPGGCIRGTPIGADQPLCCLSGTVYLDGRAVDGAEVVISDSQGEIAHAFTKRYDGLGDSPQYYFDLPSLWVHTLGESRPITPTDVITLAASYQGITTAPQSYVVQNGGQNFDFNVYSPGALTLTSENPGVADPGTFENIMGADVDSLGNLYLWDAGNFRMQVLSRDGTWVDRPNWQRQIGVSPEQVFSNADIAVDRKNDRVYVSDPEQGRLAVYTSDGDFTGVFTTSGYIQTLAVDTNSNVYASTFNTGMYKYNPDGTVIAHNDTGVLAYEDTDTGIVRWLAVGPQGDVFITEQTPNGVYKYDSNLQPVPFALQTPPGSPLTRPGAIAVDAVGNLYIYDYSTLRLFKFDATGSPLPATWSWVGEPISDASAIHLVVDGDRLYFVSQYDGVVLAFSIDGGTPLFRRGGIPRNPGSIQVPTDIAIAPQDSSLFVADNMTGRISKMVGGKVVQSWTMEELGQAAGSLPSALDFDHDNRLLVTNNYQRLQRFQYTPGPTPETSTLISDSLPFGEPGSGLGQFCGASGLATDRHGFVFVTEHCNNRIQVLYEDSADPSGFVPITVSQPLTASDVLSRPLGIAVDDRGDTTVVYAVSTANSQVVQLNFYSPTLAIERTFGSYGFTADQLVFPQHADMDAHGSLWVADAYYRLHRFDTADLSWHLLGDGRRSPAWSAYGIAVADDGRVYLSSWGFGQVSSFIPLTESMPIASIVHLSTGDLTPGETLTAYGAGQDGDATNKIVQYEWKSVDRLRTEPHAELEIITNTLEITIPTSLAPTTPGQLGPGLYTLELRVQDNENEWSQPVSTTVFVDWRVPNPPTERIPVPDPTLLAPDPPASCRVGGMWTLLLYLDADNGADGQRLQADFESRIAELKKINHPCVQIAVQIDGPSSIGNPTNGDTRRLLIRPRPAPMDTPEVIDPPADGWEAQMDDADALHDFIHWGQQALPARHFYLAIADHGNAYRGIAFDQTTTAGWTASLRADELRHALSEPDVLPIDILHLDACSMALLDVAYEVRHKVDYVIASQYIGWSFFAYADFSRYITEWTEPDQLATLIAQRYANLAAAYNLPYTISALDMSRIEQLKKAVDELAKQLKSWVNIDTNASGRRMRMFRDIRGLSLDDRSQFFDSNNNYLNTPRDGYVDLQDFAERVARAELTPDVTKAAADLLAEYNRPDSVVLTNLHSSVVDLPGKQREATEVPIDLTRASGLSLFYPAEGDALLSLPPDPAAPVAAAATDPFSYTQMYVDYIDNQIFDFTRASRWDEFLRASFGEPADKAAVEPAPPPLAPQEPSNNTSVSVTQGYYVADSANDGPSAGDSVLFNTIIDNQSAVTLTDVVLLQVLNFDVQPLVAAATNPCVEGASRRFCLPLGDIGPGQQLSVPFTFTLTAPTPVDSQAYIYVSGRQLGAAVTPQSQRKSLFLPAVIR